MLLPMSMREYTSPTKPMSIAALPGSSAKSNFS